MKPLPLPRRGLLTFIFRSWGVFSLSASHPEAPRCARSPWRGAAGGPGLGRLSGLGPRELQPPACPARRGGGRCRRGAGAAASRCVEQGGVRLAAGAAGRGPRSDGRSGANGGAMVPGPGPRAALSPARRKRRRRRRRRGP